jgi:hypothetical protein
LIVDDLKDTLARRIQEYTDKCDGPPPSSPPVPSPAKPPVRLPTTGPISPVRVIGVGVGVALACTLFPELCLVIAPAIP